MNESMSVIERYFAMWNETAPERRRELVEQTWTEDATYVDPVFSAEGHDGLDAMVAAGQAQFPGYVFRLAGPVDAHHNLARFTWELAPGAEAEAVVIGFDEAILAADGRLQAVHGFLDKVPSMV